MKTPLQLVSGSESVPAQDREVVLAVGDTAHVKISAVGEPISCFESAKEVSDKGMKYMIGYFNRKISACINIYASTIYGKK